MLMIDSSQEIVYVRLVFMYFYTKKCKAYQWILFGQYFKVLK